MAKGNYREEYELQRIIATLNKGNVEYLAFGSYAMRKYDPIKTVDSLYIWVNPTEENLQKLSSSLKEAQILHPKINSNAIVEDVSADPKRSKSIAFAINPQTGKKTLFVTAPFGLSATDFKEAYQKADTILSTAFKKESNDKIIKLDGSVKHTQLSKEFLYKSALVGMKYGMYSKEDQLLLGMGQKVAQEEKLPYADYSKAIDVLDMESVLMHYGFEERKSKSSQKWRVYQQDDIKVCVLAGQKAGGNAKFGIDLNGALQIKRGNSYKGKVFDVVGLIDYLEGGDIRSKNQKIADLMGDQGFIETSYKQKYTNPMRVVAIEDLNDKSIASLRENSLIEDYKLRPLDSFNFKQMELRALSESTTQNSIFHNKIFSGDKDHVNKETGEVYSTKQYTTFPFLNQHNQIISMSLKRYSFKKEENSSELKRVSEKWFSEGTRTGGLWKSNYFYEAKEHLKDTNGDVKVQAGEIVNVSQNLERKYEIVKNNSTIVLGEKEQQKLKYIEANQILIFEDSVDAMSHYQVNPPDKGIKRVYLASMGQPHAVQNEHIEQVISYNPSAQIQINPDNEPVGYRFGINYLNLKHPSIDTRYRIDVNVKQQASADLLATKQLALEQGIKQDLRSYSKSYHNKMELSINIPFGVGEPFKNQVEASAFVKERTDKLLGLINQEKTVSESQRLSELADDKIARFERRETLLNEKGNGIVYQVDIAIPNTKEFLRRTLLETAQMINEHQRQPIFKVNALKFEKDFNELLENRKGKQLDNPKYREVDPPITKIDVTKSILEEAAILKKNLAQQELIKNSPVSAVMQKVAQKNGLSK